MFYVLEISSWTPNSPDVSQSVVCKVLCVLVLDLLILDRVYFHHFDREEILAWGYFSYLRIFK